MNPPRRCKKCLGLVPLTPRGRLRAHHCPHGAWCTVPYAQRRHGHIGNCPLCFDERLSQSGEQLSLAVR